MRQIAKLFLRFADAAARAAAAAAALSLGSIPVLIGVEIFARAVLGNSLGITWEYATYLMTLTFILGAAFTLRTGGHIRVSILSFRERSFLASLVEFVASGLGVIVVLFIALALSDFAWGTYVTGAVSATPAQTPLFIPRMGIAAGAWLLVLQMIARVVALSIGAPIEHPAPGADVKSYGETS